MNFKPRKIAYEQLKGESHFEADRALLQKVDPNNPLLKKPVFKKAKLQFEILWALLGFDNVTREMVVKNRREMQGLSKEQITELAKEAGKLSAGIPSVKTLEQKDEIIKQIEELLKDVPADVSKKMVDIARLIEPEFVRIEIANADLMAMDLTQATQQEMAGIFRRLNLVSKTDMKAVTIRPILEAYKLNLVKEDKGDGVEKTAVPAAKEGDKPESHSDQVIDIMNVEGGAEAPEETPVPDPEKEELENENEELKEENQDLEEQNEELQDKVEDLEAEKKNTPES